MVMTDNIEPRGALPCDRMRKVMADRPTGRLGTPAPATTDGPGFCLRTLPRVALEMYLGRYLETALGGFFAGRERP